MESTDCLHCFTPKAEDLTQTQDTQRVMRLRFSRKCDVERLTEYYGENTHENVYVRDPAVLRERIESGAAIILEDDQGHIHGASISYPITLEKGGETCHVWSELGSTRITLNGFGLYPYMVAAQTLQGFMVEPPYNCFVAEVDVDNAAVIGLLHGKLQWPEYDAPKSLTDKMEDSVKEGEEIVPVNWYHCGPETLQHQAQVVKKLVDNPVLVNKKTGETIELDLSQFQLANAFKPALEQLAAEGARPDNGPRRYKTLSGLRGAMRL